MESERTTSDADGRFQLPAADVPFRYVTADTLALVHRDAPVAVPAGGNVGDLVLVPGHALSGHLDGAAGAETPVRLLTAWDVGDSTAPAAAAIVEYDGYFRFAGLRPGTYRIAAQKAEDRSTPSRTPLPVWVLSDPVPADTHGLHVPIVSGRLCKVVVKDGRGAPVPLASVRVTAPWVWAQNLTTEDGVTVFGALPSSVLQVSVRTIDGRTAVRTVAADANEVEIAL